MAGIQNLSGVHIGTSGWSYAHWKEVFYPEHIKPARYLDFYLTRFNGVERNPCFYHIPKETTIERWMQRTPGSFKFSLKLNRVITHQKRLADRQEALNRFFDVFERMNVSLRPVLIQILPDLSCDIPLLRDSLIMKR